MTLSLRTVDDCIITLHDVDMFAAYESNSTYEDCKLISVSCQRYDGDILNYHDISDLEVF